MKSFLINFILVCRKNGKCNILNNYSRYLLNYNNHYNDNVYSLCREIYNIKY